MILLARNFLFSFLLLLSSLEALALDSGLTIPELRSPVMDEAQLFTAQERADLSNILQEFKAAGVQMAVYIPASLQGNDIASFSIAVAEKWRLGKKGADKGILFIVAPQERKMRLEVGYGLEGDITDIFSKRLLDDQVRPFFRAGRFQEGIIQAVLSISQKLNISLTGKYSLLERGHFQAQPMGGAGKLILFLLMGFLAIPVIAFLDNHGRTNSNYGRSRRAGFDSWGGGGFGGWGGGSSGSGGGFGGGGGGFGGGGASSDW